MKRNLGCFNLAGLIAALGVLVVTGAAWLFAGGTLFSPGRLNGDAGVALGGVTSHAGLGGSCSACHTPPFSPTTMNDLCIKCHQDVSAQFISPTGLHGLKLIKDPAQPCRSCHTEHHGASASLTKTRFESSMHDQFSFSLKAHPKRQDGSQFSCKDCHAAGYASFNQEICSTCHTQIDATLMQAHVGAYGTRCTACHDGIDSYGKAFDHQTKAFKLTGKHVSLNCYACHNGDASIADMKSTATQCIACHQSKDIHNGSFGQDCGACHKTDAWSDVIFDHSKSAFPLTGAHISVACTSCHQNNVFKGTPTNCYACHQSKDIHNGSFGQDCGACHKTDAWSHVTFDHSKSGFPLTGAHISVACTSCHQNNVFKGTPTQCSGCHVDPAFHAGLFGTGCASCHSTTAWVPAAFNGPHQFPTNHGGAGSCRSCHPTTLASYTCYSCHDQAQTASRHAREGITDISNCISCHPTGRGGDGGGGG
jgi:hypothetical protein